MAYSKKLGNQFNKVVKIYEKAREQYPPQLINAIIKQTKMSRESVVLDIGCGNGRSIIPFAKTGCSILGIDPGKNLIKIARKKSREQSNIKYKVTSFEKFKDKPNSFDIILSGTAFHWFDKKTAYKKASKLLKTKGGLVIFYARSNNQTVLIKKLTKLFEKHCPDHKKTSNMISVIKEIKEEISKEKSLTKPKTLFFKKKAILSKRQYMDLLNSYSFIISLDKKRKTFFFKDVKALLKKYKSPLEIPVEYIALVSVKK